MGGHNLEPAAGEDQKNLQEQRDEKYGHQISLELYQYKTQLNCSFDWDQYSFFLFSINENKTANVIQSPSLTLNSSQKELLCFHIMGLWLYGL